MGLRDKVALVLVAGVIIQITTIHCMPSSSRKACLQRCFDTFKQAKPNPLPKALCSKGIKSCKSIFAKNKNAKAIKDILPNNAIYKDYNFPEIEYPLDAFPRDPFSTRSNFNANCFGTSNKDVNSPPSETFNNLRKQMRMKRKLNSFSSNENYKNKKEKQSFATFSAVPECVWYNNQGSFPEVQYPTHAMETWGPHYWKSTLCNPYEQRQSEFPTYDTKLCENKTIFFKPYKQQFKSKTKQFMEEIERLKQIMRRPTSVSKPVADTSDLNVTTSSTTTDETSGNEIIPESDTNNAAPIDMLPIVNNETQAMTANDEELTCLANDCESEDTSTQTSTPEITSTTDDTLPVISQDETNNAGSSSSENPSEGTISPSDNNDNSENTTVSPAQENPEDTEPSKVTSPPDSPSQGTTSDCESGNTIINTPYTPIYVVPVGNSVRKIQLPIIESNNGAPIIIYLPASQEAHKTAMPTPMEYVLEIPSTDLSNWASQTSNFEMLPKNSMCYDSTENGSNSTVESDFNDYNNNTPVSNDTEPPETSSSSTDPETNEGQADTASTGNNTNDSSSSTNTDIPETSLSDKSMNSESNKEAAAAPTGNNTDDSQPAINTDAPETSPNDNPMDIETNKDQTETAPTDNTANDSSPLTNTDVPSDDAIDAKPNKEETEIIPNDNTANDASPPEKTDVPETSPTDNSKDTEPDKKQTGTAPNENITSDDSPPTNTDVPESSPSDNTSDTEPNKYETESGNTSPPTNTDVPESSSSDNSIDTEPNNNQTETAPNDNTTNDAPPSENTDLPETTSSDNSTDSKPNEDQTGTIPNDNITNDLSPSMDTKPSETSNNDNSIDSKPNDGQSESTPKDNTTDNTSPFTNTDTQETLPSDNSTGTEPNDDQTETAPNDDTVSLPETSPSDNAPASEAAHEQTDAAPNDNTTDDTSPSTNTDETSSSDDAKDPVPIQELTETGSIDDTNTNDIPISSDNGLPETFNTADPSTIKDDLPLPGDMKDPLTSLTDSSLNSDVNKDLTNTSPSNIITDDNLLPTDTNLPITDVTDNINDLEFAKGLADVTDANAALNDKTLPVSMGDMDLPLTLLTAGIPKTGLDKRLADNARGTHDDPSEKQNSESKSFELDKQEPNIAQDVIKHDNTSHVTVEITEYAHAYDNSYIKNKNEVLSEIKSKLVSALISDNNSHEDQSITHAVNPNTKDDKPLRVDIELPIISQPDKNLPDCTVTSLDKEDTESPKIPATDNVKASELEKNLPNESLVGSVTKNVALSIDKVPHNIEHLDDDEFHKDKTIDNSSNSNKYINDPDKFTPTTEEPIFIGRELTSAELLDLIKYLYISV